MHHLIVFCLFVFFSQGESVKYFLDNLEKLGQSVSLSLSPRLLLDSRCAPKFCQLHKKRSKTAVFLPQGRFTHMQQRKKKKDG